MVNLTWLPVPFANSAVAWWANDFLFRLHNASIFVQGQKKPVFWTNHCRVHQNKRLGHTEHARVDASAPEFPLFFLHFPKNVCISPKWAGSCHVVSTHHGWCDHNQVQHSHDDTARRKRNFYLLNAKTPNEANFPRKKAILIVRVTSHVYIHCDHSCSSEINMWVVLIHRRTTARIIN